MGGIVIAWLFGEGLVAWRWSRNGAPPTPGALALSSGFFALCGALAIYQPARTAATMLAVGIDVAALFQVLPGSKVAPDKHWPPPKIADPTVLLPSGPGGTIPAGNPANSALPPAGTPAPGGGAAAPPNPGIPPTGPGTVFPPGSQNL